MNTHPIVIFSAIIAASAAKIASKDLSAFDNQLADLVNAYAKISKSSSTERPEFANHHPQNVQVPVHPWNVPEQPRLVTSPGNQPRWTGPFADHKLGELVRDTPEVAAAKVLHGTVYSQIRSALPELPPEDDEFGDYKSEVPDYDAEEARKAHLKSVMETVALLQHLRSSHSSTARPAHLQVKWDALPEDTPEVAAAKLAHAKAYAAVLGH